MVRLASEIVLNEVDVELTLLGSLFMAPDAYALVGPDIQTEWFSDPFARYLIDAARAIHDSGNRLSHPAIVACLPEDCGGVPRNTFYARACTQAMPASSIGGLVHTLRDRWARRTLIASADELRSRATLFSEDPFVLADTGIIELNTVSASRAGSRGKSFDAAMQEMRESHLDKSRLRGATTGLLALDNKLNGYTRGQLYVIAGRPGMGKSAFMCSSLRRTAQSGKGVAIYSLEMTAWEIAARCMSDALDSVRAPFFGNILKGQYSDAEKADLLMAEESMAGLPIHVEDSPRLTFAEIAGKARKLTAEMNAKGVPLAVVCIDHMGLVTPSERYRGNKVAEAGEVSGQARALAKELDCCVVLLCQLSREVEKRDDKRPIMSDIRWSGEIEQDAHVIGFLYREAYYLAQDAGADPYAIQAARNRLDFLVRKNRNGETTDIRLWCSIGHSSIRDDVP
jgi:replicative DNA helicase